jgi:hypothetical protein
VISEISLKSDISSFYDGKYEVYRFLGHDNV